MTHFSLNRRSAFQARSLVIFALAAFLLSSCKKKDSTPETNTNPTPVVPTPTVPTTPTTTPTNTLLPSLSTLTVSAITDSSAKSGGNVTSEGAGVILSVGVCWDEQPNPTLLKSKTVDGAGVGSYSSSMTGLKVNTTYYVRAYASNMHGTAYGNEISFTTPKSSKWLGAGNGFPYGNDVRDFVTVGTNLFAASSTAGVFRSTDGGNSWTPVNTGLSDLNLSCMVARGNDIFVGTPSGVFYSGDLGASWTAKNAGLAATYITDMTLLGSSDLFLIVNDDVYHSSDNGGIWTNVSPPVANLYPAQITSVGGSIYVLDGIANTIHTSASNGNTWSTIPLPAGATYVGNIHGIGAALLLSTNTSCFLTNTNGVSWTNITNNLPGMVNVFAYYNSTIYVGLSGQVYASGNNGGSWTKTGYGLPNQMIRSLGFYDATILASPVFNTQYGGIYKLEQ